MAINRIPEVPSMDDAAQVDAYYTADRETYKYMFYQGYLAAKKLVPNSILDIGCGPGDITKIFADIHPDTPITGIDTSSEMLALAQERDNLKFKQVSITDINEHYDRVISSLALHHFTDPMEFWNGVKQVNPRDVYIVDLIRPDTEERVEELVNEKSYSTEFKKDFENSLRSAFTIEEINTQLKEARLDLTVIEIDQYNLGMDLVLITGIMKEV